MKEPNHRRCRLLRARRERPRDRCSAEQRDELAAFHSITSSARASNVDGTSMPSAWAVCMLMTNSKVVGRITGSSAGFEPEALGRKLHVHGDDTGDIAARLTEARDQTNLDRVAAEAEDDWNRRGRSFGRERRWDATHRCDDSHLAADQIGRQFRQSIVIV